MGENWGNAVCTKWGVQWRKLKHLLFESDYLIINWSDYDKGRLLLIFGMLSQVSVLKWCIMIFYYSTNRIWFNPSELKFRIIVACIVLLSYGVLAVLSLYFKKYLNFRLFFSYFAPVLFGIGMIYGGYMIGIYSPATMAGDGQSADGRFGFLSSCNYAQYYISDHTIYWLHLLSNFDRPFRICTDF